MTPRADASLPAPSAVLILQRVLKHQSPIQALRQWRAEKPELFVNPIEKQTGLDTQQADNVLRDFR